MELREKTHEFLLTNELHCDDKPWKTLGKRRSGYSCSNCNVWSCISLCELVTHYNIMYIVKIIHNKSSKPCWKRASRSSLCYISKWLVPYQISIVILVSIILALDKICKVEVVDVVNVDIIFSSVINAIASI